MKLWHVAQWGNKEEGPDGNDTNCIVRAPDLESAIKLAENYLAMNGTAWKNGQADVVYLMGEDICNSPNADLVILMWRNPAYNLLAYQSWHRHPETNEWMTFQEMYGEESIS